jgi:DNA-directed RNA polymerase specialized sigma24 family protein
MSAPARDTQFAAFVSAERPLLQRCAFLLVGRRAPAEQLVSATLADLYTHWSRTTPPLTTALRLLCTTNPDGVRLPWSPRARFELVDGVPIGERVAPVVTDLAALPPEQRLVLVLERVALLPSVEIAAVLGVGVDDVLALSRVARSALVARRPGRVDDAALAAELTEAVPAELQARAGEDDLAHGQTLRRRRGLRRSAVVVAVLALLVVGVTQLRPAPRPSATPPPATVTVTPSERPACTPTEADCQASLAREWRASMAEIVISHLDPSGRYFNSSSFYAADENAGLWQSRRGALALEVFRSGGGSTEIYLQIATSRAYATRCGTLTGNACTQVTFMDGNTFTLSQSGDVAVGLEGQYRHRGTEVVTVVARNRGPGRQLDVGSADLVRLLEDDRLRLPDF